MQQEKVRTQPSPLRCPYCHEGVEVEREEWVACSGCLGRHHASCWSESGSCASCQSTACLKADEALAADESARHEPDQDLIRILDAHEQASEGSITDYLLSPITLGLYPLLANERRLTKHLERNRSDLVASAREGEDGRLKRYRVEALDEVQKGAKTRTSVALAALPLLLTMALIGIGVIATNAMGSSHASEDVGAFLIAGALATWALTQVTLLAFHWGAVRRHESKQLYLGLLQRGTSEDEARRLLSEHETVWKKQGSLTALATGILCIPTPMAFALPLWLAKAWSQPLELHKQREGKIPELFPRRLAQKGAPEETQTE